MVGGLNICHDGLAIMMLTDLWKVECNGGVAAQ